MFSSHIPLYVYINQTKQNLQATVNNSAFWSVKLMTLQPAILQVFHLIKQISNLLLGT